MKKTVKTGRAVAREVPAKKVSKVRKSERLYPVWTGPETQMCNLGKAHWSIARLHQLAAKLPVMEVPLKHLNVFVKYDVTLRELVMHFKAAMDADLSHPIILDEDGELMDGRHRIMKALYLEQETIPAVRFPENPSCCRYDDDFKKD
jgi:hypothetical protein